MKLNYTSLQHPVEPVERPCALRSPGTGSAVGAGPGPAAARAPGAGRLGGGAGGARAEGRLRADRRRRPAGLAQPRRRRAARARPALRPHHRRPGLRRRARGAQRRRRPRRGGAPPRLGRDPRRPGPGNHRLRNRSSATAAWQPSTPPTPPSRWACRPCSPRASPRPTPASATAASATTPSPSSNCCSPRSSVAAPEGHPDPIAALEEACGARHRLQWEPADLDGYAACGLPATRWAAAWPRTRSSSPRPLPRARSWGHLPRGVWGEGGRRRKPRPQALLPPHRPGRTHGPLRPKVCLGSARNLSPWLSQSSLHPRPAPASRASSSTSSPTWSWSAASRATR